MKNIFPKKNFISFCSLAKLGILAGMLFFFMLSSSIPVHAEEPDGSEGSTFDSSAETEDSDDGAAQEREVETNTIDIGSGDGVWDASEENNHTNKTDITNEADEDDEDTADDGQEKDDSSDEFDDEEFDDNEEEPDDDTIKSEAEIIVEEAAKPDDGNNDEKQITKLPMVDAPEIKPEQGDYNVFGVAGQYYVSVPKSMAFRKLANGDFETVDKSYYTVNSGLERGYKLSVRVSGVNDDDTVQLANETQTVHRKVEVSTMACDIWQYRPDGTVLTVNEADESGYGKELVLDGPGKFKAKCRLQRWEDDVLNAGTWSGSILFTVSCTPEPEEKAEPTAEEVQEETGQQETKKSTPVHRAAPQPPPVQPAPEPVPAEAAEEPVEPEEELLEEVVPDEEVPDEFAGDESAYE